MAKNGCRDCNRCTESQWAGCLMAPIRLLLFPINMFRYPWMRKCPQCGHPLKWHARDNSGRFKD